MDGLRSGLTLYMSVLSVGIRYLLGQIDIWGIHRFRDTEPFFLSSSFFWCWGLILMMGWNRME